MDPLSRRTIIRDLAEKKEPAADRLIFSNQTERDIMLRRGGG